MRVGQHAGRIAPVGRMLDALSRFVRGTLQPRIRRGQHSGERKISRIGQVLAQLPGPRGLRIQHGPMPGVRLLGRQPGADGGAALGQGVAHIGHARLPIEAEGGTGCGERGVRLGQGDAGMRDRRRRGIPFGCAPVQFGGEPLGLLDPRQFQQALIDQRVRVAHQALECQRQRLGADQRLDICARRLIVREGQAVDQVPDPIARPTRLRNGGLIR